MVHSKWVRQSLARATDKPDAATGEERRLGRNRASTAEAGGAPLGSSRAPCCRGRNLVSPLGGIEYRYWRGGTGSCESYVAVGEATAESCESRATVEEAIVEAANRATPSPAVTVALACRCSVTTTTLASRHSISPTTIASRQPPQSPPSPQSPSIMCSVWRCFICASARVAFPK